MNKCANVKIKDKYPRNIIGKNIKKFTDRLRDIFQLKSRNIYTSTNHDDVINEFMLCG